MPLHFGKWHETKADILEYIESSVIICECKYKSLFIPTGNRKIYYLLAGKAGFTDDILSLKDDNLLLIESCELL